MLEIIDLTVRYGGRTAVLGASLRVEAGELVVITGSNGSGKSSLLRAVLGLVPAASGTIRVRGEVAGDRRGWRDRRRAVAYVPQRTAPGSFPLLVRELLGGVGTERSRAQAADALGVAELADRAVSTLSGGQLQRTYLARAVSSLDGAAEMLLADEPTSALDFDGQEEVAQLLATLPVARLVVSHDAAVVARAGRVLEMAGGQLREVVR